MMDKKALIEQFYEGIRESDTSKLTKCVHAQFELIWQGSADIPWSGRWLGVSGLKEFFSVLGAHVDVVSVSVVHTVSNDDVSIVVLDGQWLVGPNATQISATAANVFAFEGDKIRSYTVINDTEAFAKALR